MTTTTSYVIYPGNFPWPSLVKALECPTANLTRANAYIFIPSERPSFGGMSSYGEFYGWDVTKNVAIPPGRTATDVASCCLRLITCFTLGGFYVFLGLLLFFSNTVWNLNRRIKQVGSNVGIFCLEIKSFHFKDHAPRCYAEAHARGQGHRWVADITLMTAHTAKRWRSALFLGGILFLLWLIHYTRQERKPIETENPSQCMP